MNDTANKPNTTSDGEPLRRTDPDWPDGTGGGVLNQSTKPAREIIGGGVAVTPGERELREKADKASLILVCEECRECYDYDDEWQACPKCEAELTEVDRA